jgi:hypothetical protein
MNALKVISKDDNLYLVQVELQGVKHRMIIDGVANKVALSGATDDEFSKFDDSDDYQLVAGFVQNAYVESSNALGCIQLTLACLFAYLDTARQIPMTQ